MQTLQAKIDAIKIAMDNAHDEDRQAYNERLMELKCTADFYLPVRDKIVYCDNMQEMIDYVLNAGMDPHCKFYDANGNFAGRVEEYLQP